MEIIHAIILGIIEGLTEFLPISSTGHLIVAEKLLGYKDTAEIFAVVIQLGAILAIFWFYRFDLIKRILGLYKKEAVEIKFWTNLLIATLPAGTIGFLLKDQLGTYAVALTIALSMIAGGIIIWLIETFHCPAVNKTGEARLDSLSYIQALKVGLYQIASLIPGVSRSGATIMGGLLSGMDRVTATAFSFYLSMPILLLAGGYQLFNAKNNISTVAGGSAALIVGTVAAFLTALISIKWLLKYVSHHDFKPFAYYRIFVGMLILVLVA